jgi:hypothetical protein
VQEARLCTAVRDDEAVGSNPATPTNREIRRSLAGLSICSAVMLWDLGGALWRPSGRQRRFPPPRLATADPPDSYDFYVQLEELFANGREDILKPRDQDRRLLAIETAAAQIVKWELQLDSKPWTPSTSWPRLAEHASTSATPPRTGSLPSVDLGMTVEPGDGYAAEALLVDVSLERDYRGTNLAWTMITRLLTCLSPPSQDWDRYGDTMSALADVGHAADQAARLRELTARGELCRSEPGAVSHWAHQKSLAESTVEGRAVRALCGVFFVPFQDHESLPICPKCSEVRDMMNAARLLIIQTSSHDPCVALTCVAHEQRAGLGCNPPWRPRATPMSWVTTLRRRPTTGKSRGPPSSD